MVNRNKPPLNLKGGLRVMTWNARTLKDETGLFCLLDTMRKRKLDVVAVHLLSVIVGKTQSRNILIFTLTIDLSAQLSDYSSMLRVRSEQQGIKTVTAVTHNDEEIRNKYQQAVTVALACGRNITATELGSTLLTAAKSLDTGWETRRQRQDWVTKEVVKACEAKRAAFRHWEHGGRHVIAWENYCFLRCQAKTAVREAKQHYMERLAIQAQAAARNNDPRELYRLAKAIKPPTPLALGGQLLAKDGQSYLTTEEEKMERWSQYFDELLNPVDSQNNLPYDN
eukprot:Lankesteria_metandrocarpae@DN5226_c0_g1_i5.p1